MSEHKLSPQAQSLADFMGLKPYKNAYFDGFIGEGGLETADGLESAAKRIIDAAK